MVSYAQTPKILARLGLYCLTRDPSSVSITDAMLRGNVFVLQVMRGNLAAVKSQVLAVSISQHKGMKKTNVPECELLVDEGFENDAHAGDWHRQVSLLAVESIARIREEGLDVSPGDFAENVTTTGLKLWKLPLGTRLAVGRQALLEITQIGKECHDRCAIYHQVGDCVMPREGVFARVLQGGTVKPGDNIRILSEDDTQP